MTMPAYCKDCSGSIVSNNIHEYVCNNCGLIQESSGCDFVPETQYPNTEPRKSSYNYTKGNVKLKKMQNWYMWTNEEKNAYKLAMYTRGLCNKVGVSDANEYCENIIQTTCDTVIEVMKVIREQDGTKRARVKDGIILVCLQYVLRNANMTIGKNSISSAIDFGKSIDLNIKYITKAENTILEYVNNGKLNLKKQTVLKTKKAYDYVEEVIKRNKFKIAADIMHQLKNLIDYCEENDILLDHTPLSIGVCCFYYILKDNHIEIDTKVFSDLYNLSSVTVMKTFNKLKQHELKVN
jgi:transcription initiation factor TFIIIB Brf1 subunit/transcription initiation factor TFIIB